MSCACIVSSSGGGVRLQRGSTFPKTNCTSRARKPSAMRASQSGAGSTSSSVSASTSPDACARPVLSAKLLPCRDSFSGTIRNPPSAADSATTAGVLSVELLSTTMISTSQSAGGCCACNAASVSRSRRARLYVQIRTEIVVTVIEATRLRSARARPSCGEARRSAFGAKAAKRHVHSRQRMHRRARGRPRPRSCR